MTIRLKHYMRDGASYQARCVLAFLQVLDNEESWDSGTHVARWENCREQGYVVMLSNKKGIQLNICFFEHRNSDDICAVRWLQKTINAPNIDSAQFGDVYKDKYDVSHSVGVHQFKEMAEWIHRELKAHLLAGVSDTNKR